MVDGLGVRVLDPFAPWRAGDVKDRASHHAASAARVDTSTSVNVSAA